MTLVVGIACNDGVIIAADSQLSARTTRETAIKVECIHNCWLFGYAGGLATGQILRESVKAMPKQQLEASHQRTRLQILDDVQGTLRGRLRAEYNHLEMLPEAFRRDALRAAQAEIVLAMPTREGPTLLRMTADGTFQYVEPTSPTVAIGVGSENATPFLKFLREWLFEGRALRLADARFVAYCVLTHSIEVSRSSVGGPITAIELTSDDSETWKTARLTQTELDGHRLQVEQFQKYLKEFRHLKENPTELPERD